MTALAAPALPTRRLVDALARAEARRLIRHPLVLIGAVLSVAEIVAATVVPVEETGVLRFVLLSGSATWPLAVGTFLAANLVALRSRRHGTAELEDTTVTPSSTRTAALVAATLSAVTPAVLLVGVQVVLFEAWDGVPVRLEGGFVERAMHPFELVQGPLVVVVMALLGVALGRWFPTRAIGPLMLVPAVLGFFHSTWRFDGLAWRFSPLMAHEETVGWVQVTPSSGYSILAGFDVAGLGWHLVYLVGVAVLLGYAAVARTHRSRRMVAIAAAGALVAAVGGILQLG